MKRGGPIRRRTPLRNRTPVAAVNEDRLARLRAEQFGPQAELCRGLACCACGAPAPSDPAHVRSRGAGGKDAGNVVPLCRRCHRLQHDKGSSVLEARYVVSLERVARELAERLEARG